MRREPDGRDLGLACGRRRYARRARRKPAHHQPRLHVRARPGARARGIRGDQARGARIHRLAPGRPRLGAASRSRHTRCARMAPTPSCCASRPTSRTRRSSGRGRDSSLPRRWRSSRCAARLEEARASDPALARLGRAGAGTTRASRPQDAPACCADRARATVRKQRTEELHDRDDDSFHHRVERCGQRWHDRGGEPVDREGDRERSGRAAGAGGRAGRTRSSRSARLGSTWLRRPRGRAEALPEVDIGQLAARDRHDRLRDRQDLRGRAHRGGGLRRRRHSRSGPRTQRTTSRRSASRRRRRSRRGAS